MYRTELSDLEKIEKYRECLESEPVSMELAAKKTLIDDVFRLIDLGYGEPCDIAYNLYFKYMSWMNDIGDENPLCEIIQDMCDEASFLIDICDSYMGAD